MRNICSKLRSCDHGFGIYESMLFVCTNWHKCRVAFMPLWDCHIIISCQDTHKCYLEFPGTLMLVNEYLCCYLILDFSSKLTSLWLFFELYQQSLVSRCCWLCFSLLILWTSLIVSESKGMLSEFRSLVFSWLHHCTFLFQSNA